MKFKEFVEKLENAKGSFWQWLLVIFTFYFLRILLDIMFASVHYKLSLASIVKSYLLWHGGLFLAIVLTLHFATKERIKKVTKAAFVFWPVILLVPIIDFIFSGGQGYQLMYISGEAFLEEFLSFFGFLGSNYITYGQTIAALLGLFLIIVYIFEKTESAVKVLLGSFLYYISFYFYAALPVFIPHAVSWGLISLIFVLELLLWYFRFNPKAAMEVLKGARWTRCMHYIGLVVFGAVFYQYLYPGNILDTRNIMLASLASLFAAQVALVVNNIYDREVPKIKLREYYAFGVVSLLLALMLASVQNNVAVIIVACFMGLYGIYSVPPIRFKRLGFLNNTLIGLESALMFAAGFVSQNPNIKLVPVNAFLAVFIIFAVAGNIKDLKDYERDKKQRIPTLGAILGKKNAARILAVLTSLCFPLSIAMFGFWSLLSASFIFAVINAALLLKFETEKTVFACYFLFLALIIAYLLGFL
jgi:4-hydroxybenzoate polyprenyltransferase